MRLHVIIGFPLSAILARLLAMAGELHPRRQPLTRTSVLRTGSRRNQHHRTSRGGSSAVLTVSTLTRKSAPLCLALLMFLAISASASTEGAGSLDRTFGGDGKVLTVFQNQDAGAVAIAIQPDGKLVAAGGTVEAREGGLHFAFALIRYNTNGTLDPTFGDGGKVVDPPGVAGGASAVAIQPDGKIVAGGDLALARYDAAGTLDPNFGGGDGVVAVDDVYDIAIQADGKIVAGGARGLVRYEPDGTLDVAFGGGDGVAAEDYVPDIAIQTDGKIVALRGEAFVTRYNADGSLDTSFGDDGSVSPDPFPGDYDWMNDLAIQPNGTILAGGGTEACGGGPGGCDSWNSIFRFSSDGTVLASFYGSWTVMYEVDTIAVQDDGKIIAVGASGDGRFALVRRRGGGVLDKTFARDGIRFSRFNRNSGFVAGVALQANGRVVVVGGAEGAVHSKFALARYLT
jgi:uncharacterized delta-60 repeat protein